MELTKLLPMTKYLQNHLRAASAQTSAMISVMHADDALRTAEALVSALKTEIDAARADIAFTRGEKAKDKPKAAAKAAAKAPTKSAPAAAQ